MNSLGYMASLTLFVIWGAVTFGAVTELAVGVPVWVLVIVLAVFWFVYGYVVNSLNERQSST